MGFSPRAVDIFDGVLNISAPSVTLYQLAIDGVTPIGGPGVPRLSPPLTGTGISVLPYPISSWRLFRVKLGLSIRYVGCRWARSFAFAARAESPASFDKREWGREIFTSTQGIDSMNSSLKACNQHWCYSLTRRISGLSFPVLWCLLLVMCHSHSGKVELASAQTFPKNPGESQGVLGFDILYYDANGNLVGAKIPPRVQTLPACNSGNRGALALLDPNGSDDLVLYVCQYNDNWQQIQGGAGAPGPGGGVENPMTSNLDAGGFQIFNLGNVTGTATAGIFRATDGVSLGGDTALTMRVTDTNVEFPQGMDKEIFLPLPITRERAAPDVRSRPLRRMRTGWDISLSIALGQLKGRL